MAPTNFKDWPVAREPKTFSGDEFFEMVDRFPARVDCCEGKVGANQSQRLLMLAMLIQCVGVDEVVKIGGIQNWIDAVKNECNGVNSGSGEA